MADNPVTRLKRLAAEVLPAGHIEIKDHGEDYYIFTITNAGGARSTLPPIWIDTQASDHLILEKLAREFRRAFDPESSPDDATVPNLQTEADRPKRVD